MKPKNQLASLALCLALIMVIGQASSSSRHSVESDNCVEYGKHGKCVKCADRYWLNTEECKCIKVSDFCKVWDSKNGECLHCFPGYGSPRNGECGTTPLFFGINLIDVNCKCYDDDRVCMKCYSGYRLNEDNFCVELQSGEQDCDDHCATYGYLNTKGKWYHKWFDGCKKVCKQCDDGYYLDKDYKCQKLPENCGEVDENGKCTECEDGYDFDCNDKCVKIDDCEQDHCKEYWWMSRKGKWHKNWISWGKKLCKECNEGYFLNYKHECVQLPPYCLEAKRDGTCTKCATGYKLDSDNMCVCETGKNQDNCAKYSFCDKHGHIFKRWNHVCSRVCVRCDDGFYLNQHKKCVALPVGCAKANEKGVCLECCKQYIFDLKGCCVPKEETVTIEYCAEYKYVNEKGTWHSKWFSGCRKVCVKCETDWELNKEGKCVPIITFDPLCVTKNQDGTCDVCAHRSVRDKYGRCKQVSGQCREWDHKGLCTSCYGGYRLTHGGECVIA